MQVFTTHQPELTLTLSSEMWPISAKCSVCREEMPLSPPDMVDCYDIIAWLSRHFNEHQRKHPATSSDAET